MYNIVVFLQFISKLNKNIHVYACNIYLIFFSIIDKSSLSLIAEMVRPTGTHQYNSKFPKIVIYLYIYIHIYTRIHNSRSFFALFIQWTISYTGLIIV